MYRLHIVVPLTALMLTACMITPVGHGRGVVVAPALPLVVELGVEPYYVHGGYHYYYNNDRWGYATSRSVPWADLPRNHYPRETRYRGRADRHDHDRR